MSQGRLQGRLTCKKVVLANGSVVDANAEVNQDLFWALKGGGNNFGELDEHAEPGPLLVFACLSLTRIVGPGIITEYTLKTYAFSGQVWGGIRYYNISQLPEVMAAYYQYQSNPDKSPWANLIVAAVPTNASIGLLASMVYLKPEEVPAREAFAPFLSINSNYDTTAITSYTDYMDAYPIPDIPRYVSRFCLRVTQEIQDIHTNPQVQLVDNKCSNGPTDIRHHCRGYLELNGDGRSRGSNGWTPCAYIPAGFRRNSTYRTATRQHARFEPSEADLADCQLRLVVCGR